MTQPFFSVIIPALNEERFISKLLSSLAKQTYRDYEVILVDGKSNDKTVEIFKKFTQKYPRQNILVSDKKNVAHQRNLGAKQACGRYLIFLDADVEFGDTFLEEIHLSAVKKKFKLATTYTSPDSKKEIDQIMMVLSNLALEAAKIINKPFTGGFNTIVDRETFLKIKGYREDLLISEDHDFAMRAYRNNIETVILPEPKITNSMRRFRSEGTLSVLRKYSYSIIYTLLKGPITHKLFEYKMGGDAHRKRRKKIDLMKINTYIKAIGELESKINKMIGE